MAEGGGEPGPVPEPEGQKNELGELLKTPLRKGDEWYLVDSRWFKQWKKYVGFDSWDMYNVGESNQFPGPVDNSGLLADPDTQVLKEHLIDELDYVLVPTEAWNKLMSWYGSVPGQQPIVRKVVEHGMFVKHCKVEVYLIELKLCENNDADNMVSRHFSKADTIDFIKKEMRNIFNIPPDKGTRLWNRYMTNTYEQLTKPDHTVQDAGLYQGQVLVIEQRNADGTWPRQAQTKSSTATSRTYTTSGKSPTSSYMSSPSSSSSSSSTITNGDSSSSSYGLNSLGKGGYGSSYMSYSYREPSSKPGLCGLSNLGNTCFMNSALQCLSNTPPLTEYFLNDDYKEEINKENPLGMKGEIAMAYAELIRQIWSGEHSYVAPRMFKTQVGRFAPQFSGYQQQDSQELLAFLLDGLHEDLNRVKKKPYLELKDADGRPDSVVAKEAWDNHLRRNYSIIVDIFHGLFKSTLVCPECAKVSVTFDPFCYLTLPLPMRKDRTMEVFLVRSDPQCKPTQYRLVVPKMGTVSDLCAALSKLSDVPAENMVVTDVYNHRFHKIFQVDEMLSHIMERDDLFVYEVKSSGGEDSEWVTLPLCFRERRYRQSTSSGTILFGQPLLVSVPRHNLTARILYNIVLERIQRYVKSPLPEEFICLSGDNSACNGSNGIYEDDDMEHQEEPEEKEESPEDSNGQSDDSVGEGSSGEQCSPCNKMAKKAQECRRRLFSFSLVNSYATSEVGSLPPEGSALKLSSHSTVALDWDMEVKKLYYDDQEAEAFIKHESMTQPQKKKVTVALRDCIQLFTKTETLGEHDPWYCPRCRKHQRATKKFDLWSLPKILVVHLKRFSYNRYWRDKLDAVVEFPIRNLNMSEFVCDPTADPYIYDLVAVSNHYGGMGGGHYTAYAKNQDTGQWYYFDDSSVSTASEDQIVTKAAYVLFYQRQDGVGNKAPSPAASLGSPPAAEALGNEETQQDMDSMDTN